MTRALVTSVRVERQPAHDLVTVWNRGGNAGSLVVCRGDGDSLAYMLLAGGPIYLDNVDLDEDLNPTSTTYSREKP